jgi:hypothetical protein
MTRDCTDPWVYVEFRVDGGVGLCCVRKPIGNLMQQSLAKILHSEAARTLRHDLLSGNPDSDCRGCGLRGATTPDALQEKVRVLRRGIAPPPDFDPVMYLESNPDVKSAGVEPARHFIDWGRLEGRMIRT